MSSRCCHCCSCSFAAPPMTGWVFSPWPLNPPTASPQPQVDYRWSGDANIFLAIELPAGGSATRMVPKVSNLAVR